MKHKAHFSDTAKLYKYLVSGRSRSWLRLGTAPTACKNYDALKAPRGKSREIQADWLGPSPKKKKT